METTPQPASPQASAGSATPKRKLAGKKLLVILAAVIVAVVAGFVLMSADIASPVRMALPWAKDWCARYDFEYPMAWTTSDKVEAMKKKCEDRGCRAEYAGYRSPPSTPNSVDFDADFNVYKCVPR